MTFIVLLLLESPFAIIALKIIFYERRCAVSNRSQDIRPVASWNCLRHYAVCSVCQLFYSPELFRSACESGNCHDFCTFCCSQHSVCSFYLNLIILSAKITSSLRNSRNQPPLVRTVHPVTNSRRDLPFRPCADNFFKSLVRNRYRRFVKPFPPACTRKFVSYKIQCQF